VDNQTGDTMVNPSQSTTPTSSPGSYNDLPTPNPDAPIKPVEPSKSKRSKKWLLLLGLPVLLIGGGGVAAYLGYVAPRQTNTKVLNAFYSLINEKSYSSFNMTAEVSSTDNSGTSFAMDVTNSGDAEGNTRTDMEVSYSAFRLRGSAITRTSDQSLYVKLNDLPGILGLVGTGIGSDFGAMADKIGDKWIKINTNTVGQTGLLPDEQSLTADACVGAVRRLFAEDRQQLLNELKAAFEDNRFMTAKKIGSDAVSGQPATKYSLEISKDKLAGFVLSDKIQLASLQSACKIEDVPTTDEDRNKLNAQLDKVTISNTHVWLDSNGKMVKFAADVDAEGMSVAMTLSFGNQQLDASEPTQVIGVDELVQEFQNMMMNSMPEGFESQIPEEYLQSLEGI
jgi:hypothetical protein